MSDLQVDVEGTLRQIEAHVIQVSGITFKLTRALIRALRVMAAVHAAKHEECRAAQDFTRRLGGDNTGYLQVSSDNEQTLRHLENRMLKSGVEYARLPRFHEGSTAYMYCLENLSELRDVINEYESDRITELQSRKEKYGAGTDAYLNAKAKLLKEMPNVQLITVEEYCRGAFNADGTETQQFKNIYDSAREAEHKAGLDKEADIAGFTKTISDIDRDEKIASGALIPVTVSNLKSDTLIRNGKIKQIAKIPVDDGKYCLIIPDNAVQEDGNILIEKEGTYRLIQNDSGKMIEQPGYAVASLFQKQSNREIVPEKAPEDIKVPVPEIKRGRTK